MVFQNSRNKIAIFLAFFPLYFSGQTSIIGGSKSSGALPYAAFVSSSGTVTELTGLGSSGGILSVSMSSSGSAIIAGYTDTSLYIGRVSPSGVVTSVGGLPGSGLLLSAKINSSDNAIVGGNLFSGSSYAALISSSGVLTLLSSPDGTIGSVAINSSGSGIIGGSDTTNPSAPAYVALVSPSGALTSLGNLPTGAGGSITSVGITNSGKAIIGGYNDPAGTPYASLVSSLGVVTLLTGLPSAGQINQVAISEAGGAIITGTDSGAGDPYVATVSSSGTVAPVTGIPINPSFNTMIQTNGINGSGTALIGGRVIDNNTSFYRLYAAFVSPSGTLLDVTGFPAPSAQSVSIGSCSISEQGVGLVVGSVNGGGSVYAAFISPLGIATPFTGFPALTELSSGSIGSTPPPSPSPSPSNSIFSLVTPTSFGSGSNFASTSFSFASQVLPNHTLFQRFRDRTSSSPSEETTFLADAGDRLRWEEPSCKSDYSIWADGFGFYASEQQTLFPQATNTGGGVLVGFDYQKIKDTVLGWGLGYSNNTVHQNMGHSKVNQGVATFYSAWNKGPWFVSAALWGGYYHSDNTRHSIENITSTSSFDGWIFLPHFELGYFISAKTVRDTQVYVEPFVMLDWVNNWQGHIHEKGASGFNLVIDSLYTSLLRTEAGLRFFQDIQYDWGHLILEEKGSYINKKPFDAGSVSTFFVGSASSFSIEMFSNEMQNLGAVQFSMQFFPKNCHRPYVSLNYQGEFGSSSYQSHVGIIELGKSF